ncbi:MAG: RDD family protein [Candidatus Korobacteraceae bacterium]
MPITEGREYAGFWRRVWAGTIDVCLEIVVALLLTLVIDTFFKLFGRSFGLERESTKYIAGFIFVPLLAVGGWLYAALSESSRYRATVGKRIMHLQVVNADGEKLNFGQASVRHVMKFLSLFTLGIGFLMAAFTKRRQALHDLPNECLVIHVPEESFSLFGKNF